MEWKSSPAGEACFRRKEEAEERRKWESGELRAEYEEQKRWNETRRRLNRRKYPLSIWHDGYQHFLVAELARRRCVTYRKARWFALTHPELTCVSQEKIYCRDAQTGPRFPSTVERDGFEYVRSDVLAERRKVTPTAARLWAKAHPEMSLRIGRYWYARDEGWLPKKLPAYLKVGDRTYYSLNELARRRGIGAHQAANWAKAHSELTTLYGKHLYALDEDWRPRSLPPHVWRDGHVYYSMNALARRRGLSVETVREWSRKHEELVAPAFGRRFARDEGWEYPEGRERPADPAAPVEEVPIWLKTVAARRGKK